MMRHRLPALTLLAVLLVAAFTVQASDADRFLWNQANARMARAGQPEEFAEAAALYRNLLDRGVRNAPLLYNYGTALLLAEAPDAALDAFLRAERRSGTSADLRRNLEVAMAARVEDRGEDATNARTEAISWTRIPLFWHYQIPLGHRLWIVLLLHGALWLALILRLLRLRDTARGLAVASLTGLILFGSSVLVSLHQDSEPLPDPVYRWSPHTEGAP